MSRKLEIDEVILEHIKRNLSGLEFGVVQIIVHDGRIVQIERTEKCRITPSPVPFQTGANPSC